MNDPTVVLTGRSVYLTEQAKARAERRELIEKLLVKKKERKDIQDNKRKKFQNATRALPAKVARVNIDGLKTTKDSVVVDAVSDLFQVETYSDLVVQTRTVHSRLKKLGCFSKVDVFLDAAKEGDLEVTITVEEVGNWFTSFGLVATKNEGCLELECGVPNIRGNGDRLEATLSRGYLGTSNISLGYHSPVRNFLSNGEPNASRWSTTISQLCQKLSWVNLHSRTIRLGLEGVFSPLAGLRQKVSWQADWRHIAASNSKRVSFEAREMCGHSLKSAIVHQLTVDTRDCFLLPTSGTLIDLAQELSGLGGDVLFFKNTLDTSVSFPLPGPLTCSLSASAGLLSPVTRGTGRSFDSHISLLDIFTLGGPHGLRGFSQCGAVPNNSVVGGRAFWRVSAQTYFPLPYLRPKTWFSENLVGHLFFEAGSIGNPRSRIYSKIIRENWVTDFRSTCGVGLVLRLTSFARAELNYCWPLRAQPQDKIAPGLQFGFGLEFS